LWGKRKYPSREEIINALLDDEKIKDFENYILILERKKVSNNIGIFKGELIQNDQVILRGKLTVYPGSPDWEMIEVGESIFNGLCLDYKGEKLSELFIEGFKNSLRDGKLPFLH